MDGNKENFSVTDRAQTVETKTAQYSAAELVELLVRLPAFARQPVCKFTIQGQPFIGRLVHKQKSTLYIKHRFGKKAIPYKMEQLQAIDILYL
jgi:hypothetical protein